LEVYSWNLASALASAISAIAIPAIFASTFRRSKAIIAILRRGSYYGCGDMSYIKSGNPQQVWDTLGEVYGQIVRGEW
jgi:hypothetical protein